ncbi:MAG: FAD-binding oxidoreductase [Chloroflexota bacterium]|nr:FAD-binding oxidoreductase [Chloroflexota bacterium]MDE2962010.1 FAD-binding oxidoreductase [Chloroflexota bacterium]
MATTGSGILTQLSNLLRPDVVVDAAQLPDYAVGSFVPLAVVRPPDADEVATVMAWAHRSGVAIYPFGGRTLSEMGNPPARPGIALDLTGLNRVVDFQPADLTVSVQAGVTLAQLNEVLAQDGKHVPIAAPLSGRATVGGTLATGISGPLRSAYGLPRDWLIGISVVGADGTPTKAGGKVVKNVTGYDLNRLYTGSLGTLAVITEATFKLAPAPTDWAVIVAAFSGVDAAAEAAQNLQGQFYAPLGLHVLTGEATQRIAPSMAGSALSIAISGGRPASMKRRVEETTALWAPVANTVHAATGDEADALIRALTDLPADADSPPAICVRINTQPSALREVLAFADVPLGQGPPPSVVADVGFGGGRLLWWDDAASADPDELAAGLRRIQSAAADLGGGAIVERCPDDAKARIDVWGAEPSGMQIMRRLKRQFDPQNLLNPGRFVGGL